MSLREAAARAAIWSVIEAAAKERKEEAKAELAALEVGDSIAGKVGGAIVGKASWTNGRQKLVITDPEAFLAFVELHHATEVIRSVNPAYVRTLESLSKGLDGTVIDGDGLVVPGVEIVQGEPYLTVRRDKDAEAIVTGLLRHGLVELNGISTAVKAIPAGHLVEEPLPRERTIEGNQE